VAVSKELLEILACPQCHGPVEPNESETALICRQCRLVYRIEDDIPVMLIDEATPLEP